MRWYEFRIGKSRSITLYQQGTYPIPPSRAGVRGRVNRSSENDAGSSATRKSRLLTSKSEMVASKSLFLTSKSEMLTSKSLFLMSKSEMLTSKSLFLTSKSEMLTSKSLFLTSKSEMLASKSRFLTSKSEMLTRKSNFLINDVDCQLPPPGGEQNLALVGSIWRFLQFLTKRKAGNAFCQVSSPDPLR